MATYYEIQVAHGASDGYWKTVATRDNREVAEHYAALAARQHRRTYRVVPFLTGDNDWRFTTYAGRDDRHNLDGI